MNSVLILGWGYEVDTALREGMDRCVLQQSFDRFADAFDWFSFWCVSVIREGHYMTA